MMAQSYENGLLRFSREFENIDKLEDFVRAEAFHLMFDKDLSVSGQVVKIDGVKYYQIFGETQK